MSARADRQPFGVYPRRGFWHGYYYGPDGHRKSNIPCFSGSGSGPVPNRLPVTKEDSDRCPNKGAAYLYMKQIHDSPHTPPQETPTLQKAFDGWVATLRLAGCKEKGNRQRVRCLESTVQGIMRTGNLAKGAKRQITVKGTGWKEFRDINKQEFREFLERAQKANRGPKTRNLYHMTWQQFLQWCIQEGWLKLDPLSGIKHAKIRESAYKRRTFTRPEVELIIANAPPEHRLFYATLAYAGLRYNEARQLLGKHLDPVANYPTWKLPPQIQKTNLPQTIPMMPKLAKLLGQRWYDVGPDGKMFPQKPSYKNFYRLLRQLKIPQKNLAEEHVAFHSFRYFFCTEMALKLPITQVQILMRHERFEMTANTYRKLHLTDVSNQWVVPNI